MGGDLGYIRLLVLLPFLVKLPVFILHLWLVKAHVEAPGYGSILLAGVLLKLGGYGLYILSNGAMGIVLGMGAAMGGLIRGIMAIVQVDIKALIAYSRVIHIRLIVLIRVTSIGREWI